MRRREIAAALVAVVLTGCALSTPPTHDDIVPQALPAETAIPAAWQAEAPNGGEVVDSWVATLNDPMLDTLVAEAIANNRDLAQAAERVRIAQQTVVIAGAKLLPIAGAQVGGRGTIDSDSDNAEFSSVLYGAVSWEPDVWGRLRAQREARLATAQAIALDYAFARQSLAATVARAWYTACEARQLVDLAEQSVVVYSDLLELIKTRRTAGKDTDLNVADVNAKLSMARAQVEVARAAYGEVRRGLETILGRYPAAEIEAATALPPLPPPPGAGAPASLLERRPDLKAAELQVLAAFREEESARLALLPSFSISFLVGRLGNELLSLLHLNPWLATADIGMSVPIYTGGALQAQLEIRTAQQAQAVAAYGGAALKAFREVEDALANEELIANRLEYTEAALTDSTEAVRIATIQYRYGSRDLLWVSNLQAFQILIQAEVIKVRNLQRTNRVNLFLALGGSYDAEPAAPAPDQSGAETEVQ